MCRIGWFGIEEGRKNANAAGVCFQTLFIVPVYTAPGNTLRFAFNRYWTVFLLPPEYARCYICSVDADFTCLYVMACIILDHLYFIIQYLLEKSTGVWGLEM